MKLIASLVLSALTYFTAFAQEKDIDLFHFDVLDFYSPDSTKTRLDVYAEIPFNRVEFKRDKETNKFVSEFDLTIDIKDKDNLSVFNKVFKEEIVTPKTDIEYLAQNSQIITKNIFLKPGEYKVKLSMYEQSTKKYSEKERDVKIKDFLTDPLTISDIMIVSKLEEKSGRKYITPCVSRNVGLLDTFHLFFFVYKNSEESSMSVTCKITDPKNEQVFIYKENIDITTGLDIQNRMLIPVSTDKFPAGKFKIEVTASNSKYTVTETSTFESENTDFPVDLTDIDVAISQLQYIAKDDEMDYIESGKSDAEKRKRFIEFWDAKDPSPLTKRNEVLNEYYKRIKYSDKHFSSPYTPGWRTDMGMVYVIFGQPSSIDRHPYEMGSKPYEIWEYDVINRQFVFIDDTGFGDYRLLTPIWDRFNYK
jgi:GWxTD domain-containing protein